MALLIRIAIFYLAQHTKAVKMYQNDHKIHQMAIKCTKYVDQLVITYTNIFICTTLQNLPKLGFFGLKIYHLATLLLILYIPICNISYCCADIRRMLLCFGNIKMAAKRGFLTHPVPTFDT
jgi:hypothetical protein